VSSFWGSVLAAIPSLFPRNHDIVKDQKKGEYCTKRGSRTQYKRMKRKRRWK
jgi:hypothetical protein